MSAALLMLAVLSCEVDGQNGGITLNGPEASGGRALAGPIAEATTNFYEATFKRAGDNKIIRTTWNYAQKGRIQIEPGDYTVILLAGRSAGVDKTLLGVGQATGIGGGGSGSISTVTPLQVTIAASTTDLYFHAYPLMNNINGVADSTFETEITTYPITKYEKDTLDNDVPVFMITQGGTTKATWKFGMGALPGTPFDPSIPTTAGAHGTPGEGDQISVFGPSILVTGTPALSDSVILLSGPKLLDAKFTGLTAGIPITGTFNMNLTAPNAASMVQLSLDVPVVAIANSDNPVIWHIRGGLNNGLIDAGVNPSSGEKAGAIGGAIVLGF
jgi:hypothetical protein